MGKIKIKGTLSLTQFIGLTVVIVGMVLLTGVLYVLLLNQLGIV